MTRAEIGRVLGLPSRWAVEDFLNQHQADLHYDESDLESDRDTLRQQGRMSESYSRHSPCNVDAAQ